MKFSTAITLLIFLSRTPLGVHVKENVETSVWRMPGNVREGDWEVIDISGRPIYEEMAHHAVLAYKSRSGFRIVPLSIVMVEKRVRD